MTSFRKFTKAIKALTSPTKKSTTTATKSIIRRLTEDEFSQLECAQATRDVLEGMRGSRFTEDDINRMPEFAPLRTPPVFKVTREEEESVEEAWPRFSTFQEADKFWTAVMDDMSNNDDCLTTRVAAPPSPPPSPPLYPQVVYPRVDDDDDFLPGYYDDSPHRRMYPRLDDLPAYSYY